MTLPSNGGNLSTCIDKGHDFGPWKKVDGRCRKFRQCKRCHTLEIRPSEHWFSATCRTCGASICSLCGAPCDSDDAQVRFYSLCPDCGARLAAITEPG